MSKRAGASVSRLKRLDRLTRFQPMAARNPGEFSSSPTGRLLLEMLCHSLPLGALVLDAQRRLVFANSEAIHVLSLWRNLGATVSATKTRLTAAILPPEIKAACDRLRQEFIRRSHESGSTRPNFAARVKVKHPDRPRLSAVVSLERSRRNRAVAGFCILLQDAFTSNLGAGRGDHLALLTPAERHVAKMVANGLRNDEVAQALGKSLGTVKAQLRSTFAKLEIRTRTQLVSVLRSLE